MFEVRILGTSAAIPFKRRMPSAQVVTINDRHHLIDCGEGTQMQLNRMRIRTARLDAIFISHLHLDHILGLPGLLTSMSLNGRNFPLHLYAPAGMKVILDTLFAESWSHLVYELKFFPIESFNPGAVIYDHPAFEVQSFPLDHRIYSRGYRFSEKPKAPKLDAKRAHELGVPKEHRILLKRGNAVTLEDGRVVQPGEVLVDRPPPLSYAYCSDTRPAVEIIPYIREVDLLYHEATFLEEKASRANETYHSTARQAAEVAVAAEAKKLILGHFSARYKELDPFLEESRAIFPDTRLAVEGDRISLDELFH